MKVFKLAEMKGGWFAGDFLPTCIRTKTFETACKYYKKGDKEPAHVHKVAIEITLIAEGLVEMNGKQYEKGDIVVLEPGDATEFAALENSVTFVVKMTSVKGDKYFDSKDLSHGK